MTDPGQSADPIAQWPWEQLELHWQGSALSPLKLDRMRSDTWPTRNSLTLPQCEGCIARRAAPAEQRPLNHRQRDCVFGEDACVARTGNGPANRTSLDNIALAVIFANHREAENLTETQRRLQLDRRKAIAAPTQP